MREIVVFKDNYHQHIYTSNALTSKFARQSPKSIGHIEVYLFDLNAEPLDVYVYFVCAD